MKQHHYKTSLNWTGNTGNGTRSYQTYERSHTIEAPNKVPIPLSSDPAFRGDSSKFNPEELLISSVSSCHMLWFLHLCSVSGIIVTAYSDEPEGIMTEATDGSGKFTSISLHPIVSISDESKRSQLEQIHHDAHKKCFITNSLSVPVTIEFD